MFLKWTESISRFSTISVSLNISLTSMNILHQFLARSRSYLNARIASSYYTSIVRFDNDIKMNVYDIYSRCTLDDDDYVSKINIRNCNRSIHRIRDANIRLDDKKKRDTSFCQFLSESGQNIFSRVNRKACSEAWSAFTRRNRSEKCPTTKDDECDIVAVIYK